MLRSVTINIERLLTLFTPRVVAVRKRTNDEIGFIVFVSGHEHRPLAPIPIFGKRIREMNTADVPSTVYEDRECGHLHFGPYAELHLGESED
jgi:hypothetical protein